MTYQIPFFIVLAVCLFLAFNYYRLGKDIKRWQKMYLELSEKNTKFLMMNKNERAYFEAIKKDIEVDPERQKEIDEVHEFQRKHDKIFLSGVIDEDDIPMHGQGEGTIQ